MIKITWKTSKTKEEIKKEKQKIEDFDMLANGCGEWIDKDENIPSWHRMWITDLSYSVDKNT